MHQVVLQPSGHRFDAPRDKTILDAALAAGFTVPYSCRAAVCTTCKARIVAGQVDYGVVFGTLSDEDKAEGFALLCRAKPLSDLTVEVNEPRGLEGIHPRALPCRVVSVQRASGTVAILRVRVPNADGIRYAAGQYVDFLLADGSRRSFSIANKPLRELRTEFEFHVQRVPGGAFTDYVFHRLKPRDILRMEAPLGTFYIREESAKPLIMLASGTGFAPVKAMIEHALEDGTFDRRPTSVYWGGREVTDLYLLDMARQWSHPQLRFVPVLGNAAVPADWPGTTGRAQEAVLRDFPDLSGHQVYACGSPAMVESARRDFVTRGGLPHDELFSDAFVTHADRLFTPNALEEP